MKIKSAVCNCSHRHKSLKNENDNLMNIIFVNSVVADSWGGGEKWMLTTATGLRDRGHQIYFAGRHKSLFLDRCAEAGFETLPLTIGGDFSWSVNRELRKFYQQKQIDAVIPNYNKDVRLAGLAARMSRRKPVVLARNGLPILHNNWRYRFSYRWLVDGMITNTEAIKSKYMSYQWLPESFIRVIHNGIITETKVDYEPGDVKERHHLPEDVPVVGIFGRLVPQKQHDLFLQVAEKLRKKHPKTAFVVVGEGPLRENIVQQAVDAKLAENLYMLGLQRNVFELYRACDLVLLTSDDEGLPNVVLEAMLTGRPVLAFDVGGVRELIVSEKTGVVIPPNDVYLMSKKALELLGNQDLRETMGKAARQYIQEHFSVERMIDRVEAYLFDLRQKLQPGAV